MPYDYGVTYDRSLWLFVPTSDEIDEHGGEQSWEDVVIDDYVGRGVVDRKNRDDLRTFLRMIRSGADEQVERGAMYAFMPTVQEFMPVMVSVEEPLPGSPDYLLDVAGARDDGALDPPVVTYVTAKHLGDGVRVLRFKENVDSEVSALLTYAWRVADADVVVTIQTYEPSELLSNQEHIDRLLDGIEVFDGQSATAG